MSYPAGWDLVNITGTYIGRNGVPCVGSVTLSSPQLVLRSGTIVPAADIVFDLVNGTFSGQIPATDDPNANPSGWTYTVTENVPGGRQGYQIVAPHTSPGIDLSTVVPVTMPMPPTFGFPYVTLAQLANPSGGNGASLIGYLTGTVKSFLDSLSTAGSAVGAYLVGFIQAATGAIARTVQDKLRERVSVEDYGLIDGVHDNATILAAIAAAESLGAVLEFRSKSYTVTGPFVITTAIGGIDGGGAVINGSSATSDCFQFSAGNYSAKKFVFPSVFSFPNGYAVNFQGANLLRGYMDTVLACKGAFILTASSANNSVLDNTMTFNSVANCSESAIKYAAYNNSTVMQGNNFFGNFVDNCGAWVTMTGATSASLNDNFHWCGAVDGASLAGSVAINCNGATLGENVYEVPGFFGGFATSPSVTNVGNRNHFRITGFSTISYTELSINGIGNEVKSMGCGGGYRTSATAAATATASRATYNSGNALGNNLINVSFAIPAMSSGATVDFYMYSPFTDGYSDKFFLQPHFSQPLVVQCVEDASVIAGIDGNASANQIHIRLLAVGTVTSHTTYATLFTFG